MFSIGLALTTLAAEPQFKIVFYDVYWPFFLLVFLVEEAMGVHRRGSIYFLMLFAPLIGAFTYSVAIAFVVLLFRKLSIRRGDG